MNTKNATTECPKCKAVALAPEPCTMESLIVEWYCDECGYMECRENKDYDPSPEEQWEVTRIGGWG